MNKVKWFIFIIVLMLVGCDKRIKEGYIIEKKTVNDNFILVVQGFDGNNKLGNQFFSVTEGFYDEHKIDDFIYFHKDKMSYDTLEITQEKSDE